MSSDDLRFWLRLAFVALPAGRCAQVLEAFQTPQGVFEAAQNNDSTLLEIVTENAMERLRAHAERDVEKSLEAMETHAIRLLLLSATIGNAEEFALWIEEVRGVKVHVINRAGARPVELRAAFLAPNSQLYPLYGENGKLNREIEQFAQTENRFDHRRRR